MLDKLNEAFVSPNDPILVKVAQEINIEDIGTTKVKVLLEKMLDVAYGEQRGLAKPVLVGLAAPQIGISRRIILVDVGADGRGNVSDLRIYINPEITWKSEVKEKWYEGCFSTGKVTGVVNRPNKIRLKAYNTLGEEVEEEHEGYIARILQHEIDHLDGKEFTVYIEKDEDLHWVEDDEFTEYRNNEKWRVWKKKCPRKRWEKIKGIEK